MNNVNELVLKPNFDYFKQLIKLSKKRDSGDSIKSAALNNLQVYFTKSDETLLDKFECLLDYEFMSQVEIPNLSADNLADNVKIFKDTVRVFLKSLPKFTYLKPPVYNFINYVDKKYDYYRARIHKRLNQTEYDNEDPFARSYFNCMVIICKNFQEVQKIMLEE